MIGDNLAHHIQTAEDARAYAAAIAALRAEAERIEARYKPSLDALAANAKAYRDARTVETDPITERADKLRAVLAEWLRGDPDGTLRDGDRIVATLARKAGRVQVDAAALPDRFKTLQPSMALINEALARGEQVPGVTVPVETSLRVLA